MAKPSGRFLIGLTKISFFKVTSFKMLFLIGLIAEEITSKLLASNKIRLTYNCCITGANFVEGKTEVGSDHKNGINTRSNLKKQTSTI